VGSVDVDIYDCSEFVHSEYSYLTKFIFGHSRELCTQ
jgi:hypothetical protein